ncbi:MAG: transglutaminase family protein [Acidimicrobiales bacterium]
MQLQVGCEFTYDAEVPTHAVVLVEPRLENGVRALSEGWSNEPQLAMSRYVDGFGNLCRRATIVPGRSTLRYNAIVEVGDEPEPQQPGASEVAPANLPDEALVYTLPSRFCPSQELADDAWRLFGSVAPGWTRVQTISDWVHREVAFGYEFASPLATAVDVFNSRTGVCRDFTHLAITFCRALNIPARYVFGYIPDVDVPPVVDPMDFCAWMEVYLDGAWWTFDPRNNRPRVGRVLVARGRDALDVAMISTFGGPTLDSMTVWADVICR